MSSIGSPLDTSLLQAAQAQQTASKACDKEKADSDRARRYRDLVDLRVAELEADEAVRQLPSNDSEQAESEHDAQGQPESRRPGEGDTGQPSVDIKA